MNVEIGVPLSPEDKAARLAADIERGAVLAKPRCGECGWEGAKPAPVGAGCPKCGKRIDGEAQKKKGRRA